MTNGDLVDCGFIFCHDCESYRTIGLNIFQKENLNTIEYAYTALIKDRIEKIEMHG